MTERRIADRKADGERYRRRQRERVGTCGTERRLNGRTRYGKDSGYMRIT